MRRRNFLRSSVGMLGGFCGAAGAAKAAGGCGGGSDHEACPETNFHYLNYALDRGAMQRGWLPTVSPDYHHAPQSAVDALKDLKFGIRIHWGVYALIGSHESWGAAGANREFWNIYNILYQLFNPTDYDPDSWMDLFERSGIKFFTFTTKHHDGFCLWPTQVQQESISLTAESFEFGCEHIRTVTNTYSVMDGPYKKDIVGMLVAAARRKNIKVGLYYSHVDWHDRAFGWDPFNIYYDPEFDKHSDPRRWQAFIDHERQQVTELLTNYGKIDSLDFDIGWPKAAAEDIAGVAKLARKLQPDVIIRGRGMGAYGDYYTPERTIPGGPSKGFWKVIYPCGTSFSYVPTDQYHPASWVLESLITICAKGGNFEVCFGPMANGRWAPECVERLLYVGEWLKVNGEAIYYTRPLKTYHEGKDLWFTSSKDGRTVYAINLQWPGKQLAIRTVRPAPGSEVHMLGVKQALKWRQQGDTCVIDIPSEIAEHKPCQQAYAFKLRVNPA